MVHLLVSTLLVFLSTAAFGDWQSVQAEQSRKYLLNNIAPPGATSGSVVASPSRSQPDYFYYWVRDGALVMNAVATLYAVATDPAESREYEELLTKFIRFSQANQNTPNPSDSLSSGRLGEPKFQANGDAYQGSWGRPQNDGPALRAITLTRVANFWLDAGRRSDVETSLYAAAMPAATVIKRDLEFVAKNWEKTSYDIWEEISGQHFYTRMVHQRALKEGAALARRMGDTGAADYYEEQLRGPKDPKDNPHPQKKYLLDLVESHWVASKGLIVPTFDRDGGIDYKHSDIDTAVLLAVLHTQGKDGYFQASDSRVLSTMEKHIEAFQNLYSLNHKGYGATVLGRYPEDTYNGYESGKEGNGWFLTTAAVAELHFRAAREIASAPFFKTDQWNASFLKNVGAEPHAVYQGFDKVVLVNKILDRGEAFLARACFHGLPDGHLSEQINRHTGFMQGASDLTWSHASFLTAYWQR
ncbi:glycoside hydrolase family 15 protein [bacterium]|nr:glycoside hydrolase family 15 protein [bacterium]